MSELTNWGLGMLDTAGESWFIAQDELRAAPLSPDKPINETPVALLANFNTGRKRYLISVIYDPRDGVGQIRLDVETLGSFDE